MALHVLRTKCNFALWWVLLVFSSCVHSSWSSFVSTPCFVSPTNNKKVNRCASAGSSRTFVSSCRSRSSSCRPLSSSNSDDNLDSLRNMLESSWNSQTMGEIPRDPQSAANAAATSLVNAVSSGERLLFVDLLLPAYDKTQGSNVYDEIVAVEFCIALTQSLEQPSTILVRDAKTLRTVNRVLEARDKRDSPQQEAELSDEFDQDEDNDEDYYENEGGNTMATASTFGKDTENLPTSVPDDYMDSVLDAVGSDDKDTTSTEGIGQGEQEQAQGPPPAPPSAKNPKLEKPPSIDVNDLDSFRSQLLDSWDLDDEDEEDTEETSTGKETIIPSETPLVPPVSAKQPKQQAKSKRKKPMLKKTTDNSKSFRLASLFGSDVISQGADMQLDVVEALKKNALPTEEEGVIVVLSAVSMEEMMAIRSLAATYSSEKTIVLVNCKVEPLPRELMLAETAYSVLPLVARATVLDGNIFASSSSAQEQVPPKVVVMRRYPGDWQIHVDANGKGFELADTISASRAGQRGPDAEIIVSCLKQYLQKYGK